VNGRLASQPPGRSTGALSAWALLAAAWFAFVFFVAFPAAVLWWSRGDFAPPPGPTRWLGLAWIAAAHALLIPPLRAFIVEGRGTHAPPLPPRRLVVSGLYTRIRNPMYLLYFAIVIGEAILYRSPALCGYALGFFALEHLYVVAVEEKALRRRFGAEYAAYCARVGRWLPRRPPPPEPSHPQTLPD